MATKTSGETTSVLFSAIETRRSIYGLSKTLPIPDSRVHEIVSHAIKNCPSPFNTQSARAVILTKGDHEKLWDMADAMLKQMLPEEAYKGLAPRVAGFRAAYGSVLWFEDQAALEAMGQKNPAVAGMMPQWSEHSNGMHQFFVWTTLSLEGVGCNLQHYNFSLAFTKQVQEQWGLPSTWDLKSQLVFGGPAKPGFERDGPRPRTYLPVEDRVKQFGS